MEFVGSVEKIEKVIYAVLMILLVVVVFTAICDLISLLYETLVTTTPVILESHEMILVLGAFLLVLIGVELLDTIKAYFRENTIHVEIVVLLAIIAVARKALLLDPTITTTVTTNGTTVITTVPMSGYEFGVEMIGVGVILVCFALGYYMIKKAGITFGPGGIKKNGD